jgi:hypothetical protein
LWWYTPVIPVLGRLGQEDCQSKANLGYIASPCLKNKSSRVSVLFPDKQDGRRCCRVPLLRGKPWVRGVQPPSRMALTPGAVPQNTRSFPFHKRIS